MKGVLVFECDLVLQEKQNNNRKNIKNIEFIWNLIIFMIF
tara:strand:+ start:457 stop:576 length:120 start_codon:yes stop_codon:yes gene_type:complete